jgi:hypothetical protein
LSSLFTANPQIKSNIFLSTIEIVMKSSRLDDEMLGFQFVEYLFAAFDMYRQSTPDSTSAEPTVHWNSQCVERLLEADAADFVLQIITETLRKVSASEAIKCYAKYTPKDLLRICWVVAKTFSIYLHDHPLDPNVEHYLSRLDDTSAALGEKLEELDGE